jgi:signal transduction histidine kinase
VVPHLFDPLRSAGHRRRDHTAGLGLGLFIVRELVRAHNGTVSVSSNGESGTTFTVRLPRHPVDRGPADRGPETMATIAEPRP